jgi:general secretion pathway protein D
MNVSEHGALKRASSFAVGCAWCLLAAVANAQPPDQQVIPSYRDTDIRVIIEDVQAITGRTIIVDPRVRANVTWNSTKPMTPEGFWDAFLQVLKVHGYMAVESDGAIHLLPDPNARSPGR